MEKIKVIHVGLGGWGGNWAGHVLPQHPDIEVVAYVDSAPSARALMQATLGQCEAKFFQSLDYALEKTKADAAIIALPIAFHAPVAKQALEAGLHVIVEKPFTRTLEEAHELVALAAAKGLVLAVSQNYRFYPASQMAASIAKAGYYGKLTAVKLDFRRNAIPEKSGNITWPDPMLADMAVHHYDLMRMITDADPIDISARSWNPPGSPYAMDPAAAMTVRFPGDVMVSYRGSWLDQGPQTAWAGEWQMDFERATMFWTARGDEPFHFSREKVQIKPPNAELINVPLADLEMFDRAGVVHAVAETIRTGHEPLFFPSGRNNIATLEMVEAALRSAANNGTATPVAASEAVTA